MEPNQDRSIVPLPSGELAAPPIGANRILGEMVESSLAVAKTAAFEAEKLDALVREARRVQGKTPGISPENIRAYNLFLRAAKAGHPEAQYEVSYCLDCGFGAKYDPLQSDRWIRLAAEQGHPLAQHREGLFRCNEHKFSEGVEWYRKAAEQGHPDSQMSLSNCYSAGKGVPQDYCQAYAWAQLAADTDDTKPTVNGGEWCGPEWCQEQATAIASFLSSEQMERARELYQDFKRKYSMKR